MDEIEAVIERITFESPQSGFVVAKLDLDGEIIAATGALSGIAVGEGITCQGVWTRHPKHGRQFEVKSFRLSLPARARAIEKYLSSGLVKGIGKVYAKKIVDLFGDKTLEMIDKHPKQLRAVPGIGKSRLGAIERSWAEHKGIREVMVFLAAHGISPAYAYKIVRRYGERAAALLQENPYRLAQDITGIGFVKADEIARALGHGADHPGRLSAGILYALGEQISSGDTCIQREDLLAAARELLKLEALEEPLDKLIEASALVQKEGRIWLQRLFQAEMGIADNINRLLTAPSQLREFNAKKALAWLEEQLPFKLDVNQKEALLAAFQAKLFIITGGPGTGKSTIIQGILRIFSKLSCRILLAAPTGKAAKRMAQITRHHAQTIHSLLECDFKTGGFKKNRSHPLSCDLMIVDEASMIDTQLMESLLSALPSHAKLILVGDIDQLPSVGPGNVLSDLIASGRIATAVLDKIFRQAFRSKIVTSAHQVNKGHFPKLESKKNDDFFFIEKNEPEEIISEVLDLVAHRLPKSYPFDAVRDIQVLAPMRKGAVGCDRLNGELQRRLNPTKNPVWSLGSAFDRGDKVMQIRNNYDKKIFNGDVGIVDSVDHIARELVIDFDGRLIVYTFSQLDDLVLSYAVSIHKYQGSECPAVIIPLHTSHFKLLTRNLIYTGITRARKLLIIVGSKKAFGMAITNNDVKKRLTGLIEACRGLDERVGFAKVVAAHSQESSRDKFS